MSELAPTTVETTEVTPEAQPEAASILDHAAQFGPQAREALADADEDPEKPAHPSAQQRRDRENGQFRDGKVRHRAKSQQAGPDDVPRIAALTGAKNAAEERATRAEAELARLRTQHAPPAQIAQAERTADAAANEDPEPNPEDKKYEGNGGVVKYVADQARWAARDEARAMRQRDAESTATAQKATAHKALIDGFSGRVDAAKTKYPDFEDVALKTPAKWLDPKTGSALPGGEALDAFIMQDDNGAELLYYFHRNPAEVDALMGLPVLGQLKTLTLLSQRLASNTTEQADQTGAVARRQVKLPPKPPTPVRTEAQRAGNDPPPTDGSLSIAEHQRRFGSKRH